MAQRQPALLTADQIARLRHTVQYRQWRGSQVRKKPAQLVGGPLDGLRVAVAAYLGEGAMIGWCQVTDTGPVQVLYQYAGGER